MVHLVSLVEGDAPRIGERVVTDCLEESFSFQGTLWEESAPREFENRINSTQDVCQKCRNIVLHTMLVAPDRLIAVRI